MALPHAIALPSLTFSLTQRKALKALWPIRGGYVAVDTKKSCGLPYYAGVTEASTSL
jgi:hypothetical protein